jgi:hypothetical protein
MNLKVDLILPSEQRSGSVLSLKSLTRIASIALPAIILVAAFVMTYQYIRLRTQVNSLEEAWENAQPKEQHAKEIREQLARNRKVLNEIRGWKKSSMAWHWHLLDLQRQVPASIALNELELSHSMQLTDGNPARSFSILLSARSEGEDAEWSIMRFQGNIKNSDRLGSLVQSVEVVPGSYREDPSTTNEYDRLFRLSCKVKPRPFE